MNTRENCPDDWFLLAEERLRSADALVSSVGICYSAVELLQESIERFLKGYLIFCGWRLERTHDLSRLIDLGGEHHSAFHQFRELARVLMAQFWAQHYPGDDLSEVGVDYPVLREQSGKLIDLIKREVKPKA